MLIQRKKITKLKNYDKIQRKYELHASGNGLWIEKNSIKTKHIEKQIKISL